MCLHGLDWLSTKQRMITARIRRNLHKIDGGLQQQQSVVVQVVVVLVVVVQYTTILILLLLSVVFMIELDCIL